MERIASIEIQRSGATFVTSGECPLEGPDAGCCVFRDVQCPHFQGVTAGSDEIPSLECDRPDGPNEEPVWPNLKCGLCGRLLVEDRALLAHFRPLRSFCGVPVCDGCNEECRDFEDCPRPAPGRRYVDTNDVRCLDCVLCEYTDAPQVQDYSDADPGL
jgi:hypothetical protein